MASSSSSFVPPQPTTTTMMEQGSSASSPSERPSSPSSSTNTHTSALLFSPRVYGDRLTLPGQGHDGHVEQDEDALLTPPSTAPPSLWSVSSRPRATAAKNEAKNKVRSEAAPAMQRTRGAKDDAAIVEELDEERLGHLDGSDTDQGDADDDDDDDGGEEAHQDSHGDNDEEEEEEEEDLGVDLPATLSHAHSILLAEAKALLDAASRLQGVEMQKGSDERIAGPSSGRRASSTRASFEDAIKVLVGTVAGGGKIVWTGVGKSGLIARKLSATSMSLGLPSVYMHPTEALHGDLGLVSGHFPHAPVAPLLRARASENRAPAPPRQPDAICALSHSGGSSELLQLLPHLQLRGCPILAFSAREDSKLVEAATGGRGAWVDCRTSSPGSPVDDEQGTAEADGLVPAPTSSTTVALAMGDALILSVARACGLGKQSFTRNHPGGKLGGRLLQEETLIRMGSAAA
ncbi:SIS domain-containing protein [Acaromyces ingoldii]|uniref:SIS domain-containing protein n=1 Tax=Acaromyces ingoldii TaxID=215250 RepID=A0A316YQR6_9BASI|nr:SIS domain-containing protein [Acaromyces ingoldii]PWN91890.1 SIS domain-containing protein [Acaromyces ingoldii]